MYPDTGCDPKFDAREPADPGCVCKLAKGELRTDRGEHHRDECPMWAPEVQCERPGCEDMAVEHVVDVDGRREYELCAACARACRESWARMAAREEI
jgi:hypothetical protein